MALDRHVGEHIGNLRNMMGNLVRTTKNFKKIPTPLTLPPKEKTGPQGCHLG